MSVISIRLNDFEEQVVKNYTKSKNINVSQFIKDLIFDRIEDEYDLELCKEYLEEKANGTLELIPFEEAIKEWDID